MKKQALIVGLGQFGMSLARALAVSGIDVLAVDNQEHRVQLIVPHVAQAVTFDATDESALARAEPSQKDICVCAIGPESRENAILVTALLKQVGARMVIGRASDALTERILTVVGADEVVNPERDFGERLAKRLAHEGLLDQVPLGANLMISELTPPMSMRGRNLVDLALPSRFDVSVVGIRKTSELGTQLVMPKPSSVVSEGDVLVIVSSPESVMRMLETMK